MEGSHRHWNDSDVLHGIMDVNSLDGSEYRTNLSLDPALNPLSDIHLQADLAFMDPQNQQYLTSWPAHPQALYYGYPSARLSHRREAWNPVQVAGVPGIPMPPMQAPIFDSSFSKPYDSPGSESESQYMGSHSVDSGYGTSCAAQSVVMSSYGIDSISTSSPQVGANEHALDESMSLSDQVCVGFLPEFGDSPLDSTVKCEHPTCTWVGKCPSDKRKHEARHQKLFKCDEPNCSRKEGFGTINDLARHKKCVHKKEPERGPKMMYMCFGRNCPRPNKKWPRLDNFKQHLSRMHHEEDADRLLKKSMDWYETHKLVGSSLDEALFETQQNMISPQGSVEMDLDSESVHYAGEGIDWMSRSETPKPVFYNTSPENFIMESVPVTSQASSSELASSIIESPLESKRIKFEGPVFDAADNLIKTMTRMLNHRQETGQHSDEGIEMEPENLQLSQPQRQILQKLLSTALDRLSTEVPAVAEPVDEKHDWFQCDTCSKRTRLRCEMKKHQKRHERPYGCTFPHCAKSFGSKADWKRHESSQHLQVPSWLCALHDAQKDESCCRIFYREQTYMHHLAQSHRVSKSRTHSTLHATKLDLAEQSQFWCGFCSRNIQLQNRGSAALDERFNHIDIEHFKTGKRGRDWQFPSLAELELSAYAGPGVEDRPMAAPKMKSRKRKHSQ
ncbi:Zinc finger C2H2 [Penicillium taxi]|uniref:Zinc finger C2H2 n=1 Tax=Penicillium taxi TaxID=168475 RepID=UPI0025455F71|nr:Zinc finger C2H2 [Penicillium taxi]KAJ5902396.1 Zinc finger C2H2 [Penicillium taxi]